MSSDQKLQKSLEDLLADGGVDQGAPAYTVVQKILFSGYDSLTRQQKALYQTVVEPALKSRGH